MNNSLPQSENLLGPGLYKGSLSDRTDRGVEPASILRPRWSIVVLAWMIRFSAAVNLVASLLHDRPQFVYWLGPWLPFEVSEGRRVLMFLTSVLLFLLAGALTRGKRIAWIWTILALAVAPALHLGHTGLWPQFLINGAVIGFLFLHHRYFVVGSDPRLLRSALTICPVLALALLIFGTVRLHELRDETVGGDDWLSCAQTACELVLVQNSQTQYAMTHHVAHFFALLRVGGASILLAGLVLSLQPVLSRQRDRGEHREKARGLIGQYGCEPFDAYALMHDKHYFFTGDDRAVVPYALSGNIAVALADPIGHSGVRARAIGEFALFCRRHDWEPVFYAVTEEMVEDYRQAGFSLFKIGEGARLRASEFHLHGGDFQNLRTICNKSRKQGLQFRWYDANDGIDSALEQQLASVSQAWIEMKNAREMAFDMGAFSLEDIREHGAAVVLNPSGTALAFATWRPFQHGTGRTLDLMRHLPEARNVMDFVLVESIFHLRTRGVEEISLGLAPLANTEAGPSQLVTEERVVQFLFENLNHIYGYKSLFEFKRKYRPTWRGHYVAYRRGVHLPLVGLALVRVHAPEGLWKFIVG
jgi:phosphatidylglycerol lysyltransferase